MAVKFGGNKSSKNSGKSIDWLGDGGEESDTYAKAMKIRNQKLIDLWNPQGSKPPVSENSNFSGFLGPRSGGSGPSDDLWSGNAGSKPPVSRNSTFSGFLGPRSGGSGSSEDLWSGNAGITNRSNPDRDTPFDIWNPGGNAGKTPTMPNFLSDNLWGNGDKKSDPAPSGGSNTSRGGGGTRPSREVIPEEVAKEMTFADYLAMAKSYGFGGSPDYGAMEGYLRDNASQGDSRLNSMYTQLRSSIDADAPVIRQNYDNSRSEMDQNAAGAQTQINQGYDAARNAQSAQMKALGIEEAAAVLASNGGLAASDQGARNAGVETNRLANTQQSIANKASAENYNTGIGNAAGLEGQMQRANLQSRLAEQLAGLNMKQEEDSVNAQDRLFSAAQYFQGQDGAKASAQGDAYQQDIDNQIAFRKLVMDETKASGSAMTIQEALGNMGILQEAGKQAGVADDAEAFSQFIKNLEASGRFN